MDNLIERQDALYANEPWAKLATEAGYRPYNTESSARAAFDYCADRITSQSAEIARLTAALAAVLEWWPENSENNPRYKDIYGTSFGDDIKAAREAIATKGDAKT